MSAGERREDSRGLEFNHATVGLDLGGLFKKLLQHFGIFEVPKYLFIPIIASYHSNP